MDALSSGRTFSFENEVDDALSVTGERYHKIIIKFFVLQLEDVALEDILFQQEESLTMLLANIDESFSLRAMSHFGVQN